MSVYVSPTSKITAVAPYWERTELRAGLPPASCQPCRLSWGCGLRSGSRGALTLPTPSVGCPRGPEHIPATTHIAGGLGFLPYQPGSPNLRRRGGQG